MKELTDYIDDLLETSEDEEEKKKLEAIKGKLEPIQLSAISSHKTGVSKGSWDGPANKTRAKTDQDASYFAKIYAWQDSGKDSKQKTSYKFIHHEVSADGTPGPANLRGCQTGIAVLNGARGGTVIPAADRSGVWSHLASHIKDGDATPAKLLEDMNHEEIKQFLLEWEVTNVDEKEKKELEEKIKALEDENQKLKEADEKAKKELEEKGTEVKMDEKIDERFKKLEEQLGEKETENKKLSETIKTLVDKDKQTTQQLREARVKAIIKELEDKGIYPAQLEIARSVLLADGDTVKFFEGEGAEKKEVSKSINDAVVMILEALPKEARIDTSEKARKDHETESKEPYTFEEIKAKTKEYAEKHNISLDEAEVMVVNEAVQEGRYPGDMTVPE